MQEGKFTSILFLAMVYLPVKMKLKSFLLNTFIILGFLVLFSFLAPLNKTYAASLTWDGGGSTNNWSECTNWTTDVCPAAGDTVTFNGTSTKDSTVNSLFNPTETIVTINVNSGYTGTITLGTTLHVTTSFVQAAGTFTAANQTLDMNGSFTLSAGTFTASSGSTTLAGAMTISGSPTFNHNSGTFTFDGTTTATLSCNNVTFNLVSFAHTGSIAKTVNSNCSLPLGNNSTVGADANADLTLNGTLSGTGTLTVGTAATTNLLTLNSGSSLSGFSGLVVGAVTISGATYNFGSYTTLDVNGAFTLSSAAVFTAPSGTATFASTFTLNSGTTFNANGGTVTFDGGLAVLSCNNTVFNFVIFNNTATKTVNSDCSLPLGSNPTIGNGIILTGILSGSGTMTFPTGGLTLNTGAVLSGFNGLVAVGLNVGGASVDFSSYTLVDIGNNFNLNSGAFTAPSGTMSVGGIFNHTGGTFTHSNGTIVLDGTTQTILGVATSFYNLTRITAGTLTFPAGITQTILNTLTLKGVDSSNRLLLRSSSPGTQWNIDPQRNRSIDHLSVQDSHNINATDIIACNSVNNGNNTAWNFSPSSCNNTSQLAGSTTEPQTCGNPPPGTTLINLYSALPKGGSSILIYFTDAADPYDHYALEYGTKSGVYTFAAENIGGKGTRTYEVKGLSPSTTYYFRVRAGNSCASGEWSNEIFARTLSSTAGSNLITSSSLNPITENGEEETGTGEDAGSGVCSYYTVKKGDSLSAIAGKELRSVIEYKKIATLNEDTYPTLKNSFSLEIGWKLKIKCDPNKAKDSPTSSEISGDEKTYDVDVKVTDEENKPVGGASVTLHSTPRQAKTNDKGIATFKQVEKGEHTVIIAYGGETGEQKMVLAASDNVKRYELNVKIQRRNPLLSPVVLGIIGVLIGVIVVMGVMLRKKRNFQENKL